MADIYRTALTTSLKSPSPSSSASSLIDEAAAIARRRWKAFAIAMGAMLAVLLIFTLTTKKTYTTEAGIIVGMGKQPTQSPDATTNLPILNALMVVSGVQSGENVRRADYRIAGGAFGHRFARPESHAARTARPRKSRTD